MGIAWSLVSQAVSQSTVHGDSRIDWCLWDECDLLPSTRMPLHPQAPPTTTTIAATHNCSSVLTQKYRGCCFLPGPVHFFATHYLRLAVADRTGRTGWVAAWSSVGQAGAPCSAVASWSLRRRRRRRQGSRWLRNESGGHCRSSVRRSFAVGPRNSGNGMKWKTDPKSEPFY